MSQSLDKYYTELDKDLQKLAAIDWPTFVSLVGEDAISAAKVCILKSRGKSIRFISGKLAITKNQSEYNCKKCPTISDRK